MSLPSFDRTWKNKSPIKPRIQVLEVRPREEPDGEPIAWLVVERTETYQRGEADGPVKEATIRLVCERIMPKFSHAVTGRAEFSGAYDKDAGVVSLASLSVTGVGSIFNDLAGLRGQRVGTYLLNEIVTWAKQWPDATVKSIELLVHQASEENTERRNRFYEQFGLVFDYRDPKHEEGFSRRMPGRDLNQVDTWRQNIKEWSMDEYLATTLYDAERARADLRAREQAVRNLVSDRNQAEAAPLRWALRILFWRYRDTVLMAAAVILIAVLAWFKLRG